MKIPTRGLTARQREFLSVLVRLWRERGEPIHYRDLAEHVGVSRFSAYDMLRVLESKGLAESSYAVERGSSTAGRSSVFYAPTAAGLAEIVSPTYAPLADEWRAFRERLLCRLREDNEADYGKLLDDLMEQIPRRCSPLVYCGQVIAALLINLSDVGERIMGLSGLEALRSLMASADATDLGTLTGLSLGAGMSCEGNRSRLQRLFGYSQRHQELLQELGEEGKTMLTEFLRDAIDIIGRANRDQNAGLAGGIHD